MKKKLGPLERKYIEDFIKSSAGQPLPVKQYYIISGIISLAGLFLLVSAVVISLNNLTDRTALWILFPGLAGGLIAMLLGNFLFRYIRKYEKSEKAVRIIKKLIDGMEK